MFESIKSHSVAPRRVSTAVRSFILLLSVTKDRYEVITQLKSKWTEQPSMRFLDSARRWVQAVLAPRFMKAAVIYAARCLCSGLFGGRSRGFRATEGP